MERVVVKYIPDMTVLYTQFKTGDIDVAGLQWITPDHYEEAKQLEGKTVQIVGNAFFESLTLNNERPQFKELAVRQALYYALDKQAIIDAQNAALLGEKSPQQALEYGLIDRIVEPRAPGRFGG